MRIRRKKSKKFQKGVDNRNKVCYSIITERTEDTLRAVEKVNSKPFSEVEVREEKQEKRRKEK